MSRKKLPTPAELIKNYRDFTGESQEVFGDRFGKTQSQISKYERGELDPSAEIIIHCMTFLDTQGSAENLAPKRLAKDIETLVGDISTLPLRRAIRNMLQFNTRDS